MQAEVFFQQKDIVPLTKAFIEVLLQVNTASDRLSILESSGLNSALLGNLRLDSQPNIFAQALVAEFKRYRIDSRRLDYHPMVSLLSYFCDFTEIYNLSEQNLALFSRLVQQGEENFKALKVRGGVV